MKKKLTVNTLAVGNLKKRKKQYTIMIIGIVLAMVFSSSILFLFSSLYSSINQMQAESYGRASQIWLNADKKIVDEAKEKKLIGDAGYAHIIGYAYTNDEEEFNGTSVAWLDENAKELAYPVLLEGSYPVKDNEIAIESLSLSKMNIKAGVGDTITLKVKNQNGEETLEGYTEKAYKLVGILKNKKSNIDNTAADDAALLPSAFVAENTQPDIGGKEALTVYMNLYSDTIRVSKAFDSFFREKMGFENVFWISKYEILYTNDQTGYNMQYNIIFSVLIIAVLMIVSCLGVITSFNSNLKERKKQIGMLRAVGATKRQIVNIFGREAFILSIIATPISVLISYLAVRGIVKLLGSNFIFVPNWWVLIACAVFSIICVMIAALIPLVSATKISPIQSIRNIDINRKVYKKHIKSKKEFKVPSLIAERSITFGKGRQIAVSVLLVIAIIGSGYAFSWYSYAKDEITHLDADYQLHLSSYTSYANGINFKNNNKGFSESDKQTVLSNPYIDNAIGVKTGYINALVPFTVSDYRKELSGNYMASYLDSVSSQAEEIEAERKINKENYDELLFSDLDEGNSYSVIKSKAGYDEYITMDIIGIDSDGIEELNKKIYDGKIDIDKLNSGEEVILLAPEKVGVYFSDSKYGGLYTCYNDDVDKYDCIFTDACDFNAGDSITLSTLTADAPLSDYEDTIVPDNLERADKDVKICALINAMPGDFSLYGSNLSIITTTSGMNKFAEGLNYKEINLYLNQTCNDEIDDAVQEVIKSVADNVENSSYSSEYAFRQDQKIEKNKTFTAMLAIVILFFTICLAIINNSITSSIRESKTKIGTLRAVGASQSDLVSSYIKQLLSMLLWGIVIGFAGFCISYIISLIKYKNSVGMVFNPLGAMVFCAIVFIVCSVNLWSKIRREMKNSIVENIREL